MHHSRGIEFVLEHYALSLFRPGDWFNTMLDFDAAGRPLMIYCNVALPYADDGASLTWIDLDLDVVLSPGAAAELVDREEFEANAVHYGYPRPVVERARTMADELLSLAQAGREPFRWDPLGRVLERLDVQRPSA